MTDKQKRIIKAFRATPDHVARLLKQNYEQKIYMVEYTTREGVRAYKWDRYPTGHQSRIETIDGHDIPIFER